MLRVVGTKAAQFISDCSRWVKEYCPLNARNWINMDKTAKDSLRCIISSQCAALYRGWHYLLKERYYIGYSITEAKRNRLAGIDINKWEWLVDVFWSDPKQQHISDNNKKNKLKQTVLHSNGAKSTARILEELVKYNNHNKVKALMEHPLKLIPNNNEILCIHAMTGLMEPDAEANLKALRELHEKQLQDHGVDRLTPQEAFPMVLKGLGAGPKSTKKARGAFAEVRAEIEQLQQAVADKECALRVEIERVEQESLEREKKLRQESIDRENKLKQKSIEREKKMRAKLMAEL
ncbi:Stress response protein nst1, partial [Bienertia sinuspersici]